MYKSSQEKLEDLVEDLNKDQPEVNTLDQKNESHSEAGDLHQTLKDT